jgi:FkbM family methyltransferase
LGAPAAAVFPYISAMFAGHFGVEAIAPHAARIDALIRGLADQDSRDYVRALSKFRWTMAPLDLPRNACVTGFYAYRAKGIGPRKGDHIVDCGAYTGDTAEAYLDRLGGEATITAIEPMQENFRRLVETIHTRNWSAIVMPVNAAVGAADGVVTLSGGTAEPNPRATAAMHGRENAQVVQVAKLDTLFSGRFGTVDLVKIDIEGFELDALRGAQNLIQTVKPDLAIAGYHKSDHMWEVPEAIWALDPDYEIYAGHHPAAPYEIEFFCTHPSRRAKAA